MQIFRIGTVNYSLESRKVERRWLISLSYLPPSYHCVIMLYEFLCARHATVISLSRRSDERNVLRGL